MTYRYHGHHVGDINRAYYPSKEEEESNGRAQRDPITLFGDWLENEGIACVCRRTLLNCERR